MGRQGHALPLEGLDQHLDRGDDAVLQILEIFPPINAKEGAVGKPFLIKVEVAFPHLLRRQALQEPQGAFAKDFEAPHGQFQRVGDRIGEKTRPLQVAGIDRVERDTGEPLRHGFDLFQTAGREGNIDLTVIDAEESFFGLGMTEQINKRGRRGGVHGWVDLGRGDSERKSGLKELPWGGPAAGHLPGAPIPDSFMGVHSRDKRQRRSVSTRMLDGNIKTSKRFPDGFTLIELLIVVAIIAILAAIAVPNFLEAMARSKVGRELSDMRVIAIGLENYQIDHGTYPPHGEILNGNTDPSDPIFPAVNAGLGTIEFVSPLLTTPVAYIKAFPEDPFLAARETEMLRSYGYIQSEQMRDILAGKGIPFLAQQAAKIIDTHGYWRIYAAGPDRDKGDAKESVPYDPTNGTISNGDIIRSQLSPNDRRAEDE